MKIPNQSGNLWAKAHLQLNLSWDVKGNKDGFYQSMNRRRMIKENVAPLLKGTGIMVKKDIEKAKVLIAFFISLFSVNTSLKQSSVKTVFSCNRQELQTL